MGKGDIKTKRGKRFAGSYGRLRPKKVNTNISWSQAENKKIKEIATEKSQKKVTSKKSAGSKKSTQKK